MRIAVTTLTEEELAWVKKTAHARHDEDRAKGRAHAYGAGDGYALDILGAAGEIAVAKYFQYKYGMPANIFQGADVGPYEVRSRSQMWHNTILHPRDRDDRIFVSAVVQLPKVYLKGWIPALEGKRPEFWKDPAGGRPAYFVPDHVLYEMRLLKEQDEQQSA